MSVLLVMVTRTASSPPVWERGLPIMETSDIALPCPLTFFSWLSAALLARSTSADTEASKEEAAAEADAAAAEALARADAAADASAEGAVPEKDAVSGAVGRSVEGVLELPLSSFELHDTSVRVLAMAATRASEATAGRGRTARPGQREGLAFIGSCPFAASGQ